MKKSNQLILAFIFLSLFSFQTIIAQPLFVPATSHATISEPLEIALDARHRSNSVLSAHQLEAEYIMPTSEELELITSVYVEYEIQLEDWMIEPDAEDWQAVNEENVELESWMYQPTDWLQ